MTPAYIAVELRRLVRADAGRRCGYCHTPEALIGMPLEFEHIYPEALGGLTIRENLWLACTRCKIAGSVRPSEIRARCGAVSA